MATILDELHLEALGGTSIRTFDSPHLLYSIRVGRGQGCKYDDTKKTAEYWIMTRKPLSDSLSPTMKMIVKYNVYEEERENEDGLYAYHLEYFPRAWMADIWPDLVNYKIETHNDREESLMEFALRNGCDFMDMNTMTIYKHF